MVFGNVFQQKRPVKLRHSLKLVNSYTNNKHVEI
nr:MAG TPA: hypothetical protein [Bacteriophage sp.]